MEGNLVLWFILVHLLSLMSCDRIELNLDVNCYSCHQQSPPKFGCRQRHNVDDSELKEGIGVNSLLYDKYGIDVVGKCHVCAIEDTYFLNPTPEEQREMPMRRRLCLTTNGTELDIQDERGNNNRTGTPEPGMRTCTYQYPVGTGTVIESCICNWDFCNGKEITDIGGTMDLNSFPPPEPYGTGEMSAGVKLNFGLRETWMAAIFLIIIMHCGRKTKG